jgi:hypothetical protein
MSKPPHSRMDPESGIPAGWATVRPRGADRATVWRAGQGAGALAALCMLAAEAEAAGFRQGKSGAGIVSLQRW